MIRERKSVRLLGYNYSSDNLYFVTSCVQNRICCFGEIIGSVGTGRDPSLKSTGNVPVGTGRDLSLQNGTPSLPKIPKMQLNEYGEIAKKQWNWLAEQYRYIILHAFVIMPNHIHGIIEIRRSRIKASGPTKIKPLPKLIGAYKTTVSKQIHLAGLKGFQWQRSFYEHIISDEIAFERISDYIFNNPINWEQDEFYN